MIKIFTLLATIWSWPVTADVLEMAPDGFSTRSEVLVKAPPTQVWSALVNDIGQWWSPEHSWFGAAGELYLDTRPEGCFCERSGNRVVRHMGIGVVWPPRQLRLLGGLGPLQGMGVHGALDISLQPSGEHTRIDMVYRVSGHSRSGLQAVAPAVDRVLSEQLGRLARHLDQARPSVRGPR